jgi:hypothetical protein
MPSLVSVKKVMGNLLGADLEIGAADGGFTKIPAAIAVYAADDGAAMALIACDIRFATYMGAALAMVPADVANECIDDETLSSELAENFHEIMNIAARCFNYASGSTHVKLAELLVNGAPPPDSVMALLANATQRMDLEAEVPGYGSGRLTIIGL